MASRGCKYHPDQFCFICGVFISGMSKKFSLKTSIRVCEAYKKYLDMPVTTQDKPWVPHYCCTHCKKTLEGWLRGEKRSMIFYKPRIWLETTNYSTNCFFCSVDVNTKWKGKTSFIIYPYSIVYRSYPT